MQALQKTIQNEKFLILRGLLRSLPFSMRDHIKKKYNQSKIRLLSQQKDGLYNQNQAFKAKVHRVLDMFGNKERNGRDERVNFCCKSINANVLPNLDLDSMNSHGNTKVRDVSEYIFFDDGLYKYVIGAPPGKSRRKNDEQCKKATDFMDLLLLTNLPDETTGGRIEITLHPDMNLDTVRYYFHDLIDVESKTK